MNITPVPNELLVWSALGAPVISMNVDLDFDAWTPLGAPVEDIDESYSAFVRRRAQMF